jgi:hypothetical protein
MPLLEGVAYIEVEVTNLGDTPFRALYFSGRQWYLAWEGNRSYIDNSLHKYWIRISETEVILLSYSQTVGISGMRRDISYSESDLAASSMLFRIRNDGAIESVKAVWTVIVIIDSKGPEKVNFNSEKEAFEFYRSLTFPEMKCKKATVLFADKQLRGCDA